MVLVTTPQDRPLFKFIVVRKPWKDLPDYVFPTCVEFFLESLFPFIPCMSIDRRFDLDQVIVDRVVGHDVKFSLMATTG